MANKKSEDILAGIFIFLCVVALIIIAMIYLAAIITPIVILGLFLVNLFRYRSNDRYWRSVGFWLTQSEKDLFKQSRRDIENARKSQEEVAETLQNSNVAINKDGRISVRSYKGKALRSQLESANRTLDESAKLNYELSLVPQDRWKSAKKHYSMAVGWGCALIPWAAFFLALAFNIGGVNDMVFSVTESGSAADSLQIDVNTAQKEQFEMKQEADTLAISTPEPTTMDKVFDYGTAAIPVAVGSLAVWLIAWIIGIIVFVCKNKKPPFVNLQNVDTYSFTPKDRRKAEDETKKKSKAKVSAKEEKNSGNKDCGKGNSRKDGEWAVSAFPDGQDGIIITNNNGNPGKTGICAIDGHYCLYAEYLEDSDFSEALRSEMGGMQSDGKWNNPIPEPYYGKINAGEFHRYFDSDKEFHDYVLDRILLLKRILERHHRTYTWKQKVGSHDGWKIFIWQFDILACEHLSPNEGKLFIDTSLDKSSGNIIILMGNRRNDSKLLKDTLLRLGCSDKPIDNNGRAVLETFPYTTAGSVAERIIYWIGKIDK